MSLHVDFQLGDQFTATPKVLTRSDTGTTFGVVTLARGSEEVIIYPATAADSLKIADAFRRLAELLAAEDQQRGGHS